MFWDMNFKLLSISRENFKLGKNAIGKKFKLQTRIANLVPDREFFIVLQILEYTLVQDYASIFSPCIDLSNSNNQALMISSVHSPIRNTKQLKISLEKNYERWTNSICLNICLYQMYIAVKQKPTCRTRRYPAVVTLSHAGCHQLLHRV